MQPRKAIVDKGTHALRLIRGFQFVRRYIDDSISLNCAYWPSYTYWTQVDRFGFHGIYPADLNLQLVQ
ncbi:hypothetical protein WJX72_005687 [[Myrmecia] bisecta]|uniref:Uncharacterized protein n=1 Tax=[Myrmecia] bisecta TaxID=41462 RepID=A0AAW1PFU1_9CHLO